MADGIKSGDLAAKRFLQVQNEKVPVARGYSTADVNGDAIQHPKAIMGVDAAADDGRPWVVGPGARNGRGTSRIGRHDQRSGLDKAMGSLHLVGGKPSDGGVHPVETVTDLLPSTSAPKVR